MAHAIARISLERTRGLLLLLLYDHSTERIRVRSREQM